MLIQERESSSRQLRRIAFRFYNFCSCWITRQEARRFSPSTRDCEIILRASRASVSDFRASQRERALSLFAHISSSPACACTRRDASRGCVRNARAYTARSPLLRKVFQNCAKPCLVWQCGKRTLTSPSRIGSPRRDCTAADGETPNFAFGRIPRSEAAIWEASEFPQNRPRECTCMVIF